MFHFVKKCLYLIIPVAAFFGWMSLGTPKQKSHEENALIIGTQMGYPPFEYIDSQGKFTGFDIELGELLAKKLNKKLVVKDMDFEGVVLSLKQGKIDLAMAGMNITPSRLKEIHMVPYHGSDLKSFSLIFWNRIPDKIKSIEDIGHMTNGVITVESGSIAEIYMNEKYPQLPIKSLQGALNPLMDVKFGKSTANLVEPDVATFLQAKHPEIHVMSVPVGKEDHILGCGIGVKKGNTALMTEITSLIQELKDSGVFGELEKKWFKGEE